MISKGSGSDTQMAAIFIHLITPANDTRAVISLGIPPFFDLPNTRMLPTSYPINFIGRPQWTSVAVRAFAWAIIKTNCNEKSEPDKTRVQLQMLQCCPSSFVLRSVTRVLPAACCSCPVGLAKLFARRWPHNYGVLDRGRVSGAMATF